ncbi:MAG: DUF2829 domain-containing protein [Pseudomonadota bacterium]
MNPPILYVGTKLVVAEPMTRGTYSAYRGQPTLVAESGEDPGYLVEYRDGGKPNMPDRQGYVSWSPADVFERSYRVASGLPFGVALDALKLGERISRAGWNGKGMHLWLNKGSSETIPPHGPTQQLISGVDVRLFDLGDTGTITRLPNINMRAADGATVTGWLVSQTDMLADDWCVLP